jgi:hypothetical protein
MTAMWLITGDSGTAVLSGMPAALGLMALLDAKSHQDFEVTSGLVAGPVMLIAVFGVLLNGPSFGIARPIVALFAMLPPTLSREPERGVPPA